MLKPLIGITSTSSEGPFGLYRSCIGQDYIDAIVAAGGTPIGIPLGLDPADLSRIQSLIDGLMLPGGLDVAPCHYGQEPHPQLGGIEEGRDALELPLATWALREKRPVLGICRGIQVMAVAGGGTLYQDIPSQLEGSVPHDVRGHGRDHLAHAISVEPDSTLAVATGKRKIDVNSFHHQAVLEVPDGFSVTARAADGVIEAMEKAGHPFAVGVQCHPENTWRTTASEFAGLFRAFVQAAARYAEQRDS